MKKITKLLALIMLAALLLVGCGRSDVTITANDDGSFTALVSYGITKALMGTPEAREQVRALITDSLEQNNIEYTESENDEYVVISVERSFADIAALTSEEAWRGITMVPKLSADRQDGALWVRYEDGALKVSGTLDVKTFGAEDIVLQDSGLGTNFGGSLSVVLPGKAASANAAESNAENTYTWGGDSTASVSVELVSAPMKAAESYAEENKEGAADNKQAEKGIGSVGIVVISVIFAAAVIIGCVVLKKKRSEKLESDGHNKEN